MNVPEKTVPDRGVRHFSTPIELQLKRSALTSST
jgi:hypothetical protein